MKLFKVALPILIILVSFIFWIGLRDADSANLWPNKHGELCWMVTPPSGTQTIVKLAILNTIKDHYIIHGTITENGYVRCVNGNAEIVGNKVIMQGSTAGMYGTELIGGIGQVELDLNTLNGISEGLNMWYDTSTGKGNWGEVKYDGVATWTLISCN